jgi:hypothetical protein
MIINPNNFFEEELIKEFASVSFIKPQSVVYLSNFLKKNITTDNLLKNSKKPQYLTDLLNQINEAPNYEKTVGLTLQLAETTLFVSSFFPELILKRNNSLDYYLSVGILAYSSLESFNNKNDLKIAYKNISDNFKLISQGIGRINKSLIPNISHDVALDLFEQTNDFKYLQCLNKKSHG